MNKEELKKIIDDELLGSESIIKNLLPEKYSEDERKKIASICISLLGLNITRVLGRIKQKQKETIC